jgi:hypothetical protein
MHLHMWYRQCFQNGERVWFKGDAYLKNGKMTGIGVNEYALNPRKQAKCVRESVALPNHGSTAHLWRDPIAELDVPEKVRMAYSNFLVEEKERVQEKARRRAL